MSDIPIPTEADLRLDAATEYHIATMLPLGVKIHVYDVIAAWIRRAVAAEAEIETARGSFLNWLDNEADRQREAEMRRSAPEMIGALIRSRNLWHESSVAAEARLVEEIELLKAELLELAGLRKPEVTDQIRAKAAELEPAAKAALDREAELIHLRGLCLKAAPVVKDENNMYWADRVLLAAELEKAGNGS
jgi:hypothetical protein